MDLPINYEKSDWRVRKDARLEYINRQNGKCYFCDAPLDGPPSKEILGKKINKNLFPKNFFKYPIHLHHSHTTGMTIGAVHNTCNAVLWEYEHE